MVHVKEGTADDLLVVGVMLDASTYGTNSKVRACAWPDERFREWSTAGCRHRLLDSLIQNSRMFVQYSSICERSLPIPPLGLAWSRLQGRPSFLPSFQPSPPSLSNEQPTQPESRDATPLPLSPLLAPGSPLGSQPFAYSAYRTSPRNPS